MAMSVGSATAVAGSPPTFTGSGMALAIAQAMFPLVSALAQSQMSGAGLDSGVSTTIPSSTLLTMAQGVAAQANGIASGVVGHIAAQAQAVVTTQVLGRTPNPNNANTDIQPPSATVTIPIS